MKKSLLLGSVLLVGAGAFAQANRKALPPKLYKGVTVAKNDNFASETPNFKPTVGNNSVLVTSAGFSSSRNGFGMLVEETVPLSYNADLNMVAFTQRIPPTTGTFGYATTGLTAANSGHMITNTTTDNGTTWNKFSLFGAPAASVNGALARYPSGVIANTPGNTDASLAYIVGTGPCTDGSGWMANWFASRPANSTGNTETNDFLVAETAIGSGSVSENTYFSSYNTVNNGSTVWTSGYKYAADGTTIAGVMLYKGTLNAGAYTWSRVLETELNDLYVSPGNKLYFSAPKMAFSPDGLTGYILVNGVYNDATGNATKSYNPNVWKTTDGGTNWTKVNANYDWKTNHPEIMGNLIPAANDCQWSNLPNYNYPAFFDTFGGDITVDNTGKLHYVTAVVASYSSHPDSLGYLFGQGGYSYVQYDNLDKPWVFDFTTDGNGTWNTEFLTYLYTRNIADDEVAPNFSWTSDGAASLDYTNRIKVSRTNDGGKVVVTWTDSDTTATQTLGTAPNTYVAYAPNTTPSIFYTAKDVATGNWAVTQEAVSFDAVENAFYLYTTSDIVMPNGGTGFTIPTVYISSSDGSQNATNAIDYNYIVDMEILDANYTVPARTPNTAPTTVFVAGEDVANCPAGVGIKDVTNGAITAVSQNFPNPFSGSTTFNVNLNKAEVITVTVTNAVGQVVATKVVKGAIGANEVSLDAANLESGIYFYNVVAGDAKVTRKMSVVK